MQSRGLRFSQQVQSAVQGYSHSIRGVPGFHYVEISNLNNVMRDLIII